MTEATELFNALTKAVHSATPEDRPQRIEAVARLGEHLSAAKRSDTVEWHAGIGMLLNRCGIGTHQASAAAHIFPAVTYDIKGAVTSIRFNEMTCIGPHSNAYYPSYDLCANSLLLLPNGGMSLSEVTRTLRTEDMLGEVRQAPGGFKKPLAKAFLPAFSSSKHARESLRMAAGLARL